MTPERPLRTDPRSNDPDTPIRLLGAYCHIDFPTDKERTPEWDLALDLARHNLDVTIRFGGGQAEVLEPDTEKYDTVMRASAEAVEALLTVRAALDASTPSDFHRQVEKLKTQYASIVGHIRHLFFVDTRHRSLYQFVEEVM